MSNKTAVSKLTTNTLEQSGIKTNLNQNDIVEIIATDAYEKILNSLENIPNFNTEICDLTLHKEIFLNEIIKLDIIKINKEKLHIHNINSKVIDKNDKVTKFNYFSLDTGESKDDSFKIYLNEKEFSYKSSYLIELSYSHYSYKEEDTKINDIEIYEGYHNKIFNKKILVKSNLNLKQFENYVNNHNEKVLNIFNNIPIKEKTINNRRYKIINYKNMISQARISVNRNIIKNQAPELTNQLNNLFNINL